MTSQLTTAPGWSSRSIHFGGIHSFLAERTAARFLAVELDRLMSLPLDTPENVKTWDNEAGEVMTALDEFFPRFLFELEVWHFFADADLRQKDAAHRQRQHEYIADYITRLRQG